MKGGADSLAALAEKVSSGFSDRSYEGVYEAELRSSTWRNAVPALQGEVLCPGTGVI